MIALRHRTASGRSDALWEFCSQRCVVEIVLRLGSADPLAVTIRVCAPDRPKLLCHPILRLDGESWRILPAIFVPAVSVSRDRDRSRLAPRDCSTRNGGLAGAIPCELHSAIGNVGLILSNAPEDQNREMEAM